jgi:hypothetical protein
MSFLQQYSTYYCQVCNQHYQTQQPAVQQPVKTEGSKTAGIVVGIIAVVLILVALLVIIAGSDDPTDGGIDRTGTTPQGSLNFQPDPETEGAYIGTFQGSVDTDDIDIEIYDESLDETRVMEQPSQFHTMQVGNGLTLTYFDNNENGNLDASDMLNLHYAESGDTITIRYRPNEKMIASYVVG